MNKKNIENPENIKIENEDNTTKKTPGPEHSESESPDPTRYGDWEKGGRCIDF